MSADKFIVEEVFTPDNGKLFLNSEAIIVNQLGNRYKVRLSAGPGVLRAQIERGNVTAHVITVIESLGRATSESVSESLQQPEPATAPDSHHPSPVSL